MSGQKPRLLLRGMAQGVHAQLTEEQRLLPCLILQSEKVVAESLWIVQVDVEGGEVQEGEFQILGGRIVRVGRQAVRVGLMGDIGKFFEKSLDTMRAVPAHDIGRNLVADTISQDATVAASVFGSRPNTLPCIALSLFTIEETEMLGPGNIDQYLQIVLFRKL